MLAVLAFDQIDAPAAIGADTTTSSTIAGPVLPITFPVQGKCSFADTFGAARSGGRLHEGVDLIAKSGQYIYAAADGTLTKQYLDVPGSLSGNGWRLTIPGGTYFFYAHFSGFPPGLAVGSKVLAGQIIGYVGATGNTGTAHLHFEIHPGGGAAVNPTQSVKAVDGCAVTTTPTVGSNPVTPVLVDSGPPQPTLAKAVRIPAPEPTFVATTTTQPPVQNTVPGSTPTVTPDGSRWTFVDPVVVFNTSGSTALVANTAKQIAVSDVTGLAASPAALMLRVSATAASVATVTVHPCASPASATATLSVEPGTMAIGTAMVPVTNGAICVTSTAATSVKLTATAQVTASGAGSRPVPTTRVFDSRTSGRLAAGQKVTLTPATLGIATAAKGVTATFTIIDPSAAGTLAISACGGPELKAPFIKTALAAFSVTVAVNSTGLCVSPTVAADVTVDIAGGWDNDAGGVTAVAPVRVLGTATVPTAIGTTTTNVNVTGMGGLPTAAQSAVVNVTVIAAATNASVFVWPCGQPQPAAAIGVAVAGHTATFSATTAVAAGQICLASNAPATAFVDVAGVG
ncbi:MAG: peptidoglycan DD-metalloendopeptidase family protein [Ilumatobacteraceae bacterium]